jgi:hypothetical protein
MGIGVPGEIVTCHITCRMAARRYVTTTIMMPQTAEFPIGVLAVAWGGLTLADTSVS